jgi:hypothetical protein
MTLGRSFKAGVRINEMAGQIARPFGEPFEG